MNEFDAHIHDFLPEGLRAAEIRTLQVNLGRACNLACNHCHLECSPSRSEHMSGAVMEDLLSLIGRDLFPLIDVTGGSPELHPRLRYFLEVLCSRQQAVQVRTNLTALLEPSTRDLIGLFRSCGVSLVGSLPCFLEENVDAQRGNGVHARSIAALRLLNQAGYGREEGLTLNLVYNPGSSFLPPRQSALEETYREELTKRYGISFNHLLVLTNMPLGRFRQQLVEAGRLEDYLAVLRGAFNPATLPGLMCRHQLSIDWDGTVYDCDFNLALGLPVNHNAPNRISAFDKGKLAGRNIVTGDHCFGCTAGGGSSCAGALAEPPGTTAE